MEHYVAPEGAQRIRATVTHSVSCGSMRVMIASPPEGDIMAHSFTDLLTHTIFSTKMRAPLISDEIRGEVFAYLGGIVKHIGGKALLVNGTADHVHMLIRLPADVPVAECMRSVKANASKWVHEHWPDQEGFEWQIGYAAFSVSLSQRDVVYRYIQGQEEHHRKRSFADEMSAIFKKYGGDVAAFLE
ncbi:MAG: IS200/IS605 family transposase [Terriglobales bacterium]